MKSVKKSKVRIYLKPGGLRGYRIKDTMKSRRSILKKLLQKNSYSSIIKRLNILSIYNKNRYPEISKKVKSDISFIQKNFYNKSLSKKRSMKKKSSMKKKKSIKKRSMKKKKSIKNGGRMGMGMGMGYGRMGRGYGRMGRGYGRMGCDVEECIFN